MPAPIRAAAEAATVPVRIPLVQHGKAQGGGARFPEQGAGTHGIPWKEAYA